MTRKIIKGEEYILDKLVSHTIISIKDKELYRFGLECLLLKLVHCISYLCIGILLKMVPELLLIGCVLISLRRSVGGYHAKTKMGCYIFSCTYVAIILLFSDMLTSQSMWWVILVISDLIIIYMGPVDNSNKKLDNKEIDYFRKKSRYILILINVFCIFFTVIKFNKVGNLLSCGVGASALLLMLGSFQNKKVNQSYFKNEGGF